MADENTEVLASTVSPHPHMRTDNIIVTVCVKFRTQIQTQGCSENKNKHFIGCTKRGKTESASMEEKTLIVQRLKNPKLFTG